MTKKKSKLWVILISIAVIIAIIGGIVYMTQVNKCENVFDEMYYAIKEFPNIHSTKASYQNCSEYFEDQADDGILNISEEFFPFSYRNSDKYSNRYAHVHVLKKEPVVEYAGIVDYYTGDEAMGIDGLVLPYTYDVEKKTTYT